MARNISFAMTKEQFKTRSKTVTRRFGWWFLKPGDVLCGVEKGMGLKAGEKLTRLGLIRVKTVWTEPLNSITQEQVNKEGFPHFTPEQFVKMLVEHYKAKPTAKVNVIEYEYID